MFNNVALDVAIGLIFIFLLYSLLATIIQEFIAQIFDLRAKMLVKSVRVLLDDRKDSTWGVFKWLEPMVNNIYHFFKPFPFNTFSKAFYKHPTIKYLAPNSWDKPSYMGAYNFSTTLIKMLRGDEYDGTEPQMNGIHRTLFQTNRITIDATGETIPIDPETLQHLRQLYHDAQKDPDRFRSLLERWFDETMERTTGWYKKQTQWILLFLGIILAATFNVDTIAICKILSRDKTARAQLVDMAIRSVGKYDTLSKQLTKTQLKDSSLVYRRDSSGKITDSFYNYSFHDTLLMSQAQLQQAYNMVTNDIDNAGSILGLGRNRKDSCQPCQQLKDSIAKSNLPSNYRKALLEFLSTKDGKKLCGDGCISKGTWLHGHPLQTNGWVTLLGWLLTAFAISIGAPFWFDLLNKVVQLRTSVAKPKETDTGGGSSKINDSSSLNKKRVG